MSLNTYAYDGQIRRFLYQFIRIMSNFQVEFGKDRDGNTSLQQVPVFYGDPSRQAAQILRGNSENTTPVVPAMACYISAMDYDRTRVQEPFHISKLNIRMRNYEHPVTPGDEGTWGHAQGDAFTVERLMPVPYKLTLKVDVWTSNTEQKLQLLEQMLPLFNPALEIQSTDNYIDWTSLSAIYLISHNWSSRQVPGSSIDDAMDIATLTFELPIWLSLPAKVKQLGVIHKIIASIYDANGVLLDDIADFPQQTLMAQRIITPLNYGVILANGVLELYRPGDIVTETADDLDVEGDRTYHWLTLINMYGKKLINGVSEIRLDQPNGNTVVGTVAYHPTNPAWLLFNPIIDTNPGNTITAVDAIVNPFAVPVADFLTPAIGTRYLILEDIGSTTNSEGAIAWRGADNSDLIAKANDIIEYDGNKWFVDFAAAAEPGVKYVTNVRSGVQYKWVAEEQSWMKSVEGSYEAGQWTMVLTV